MIYSRINIQTNKHVYEIVMKLQICDLPALDHGTEPFSEPT